MQRSIASKHCSIAWILQAFYRYLYSNGIHIGRGSAVKIGEWKDAIELVVEGEDSYRCCLCHELSSLQKNDTQRPQVSKPSGKFLFSLSFFFAFFYLCCLFLVSVLFLLLFIDINIYLYLFVSLFKSYMYDRYVRIGRLKYAILDLQGKLRLKPIIWPYAVQTSGWPLRSAWVWLIFFSFCFDFLFSCSFKLFCSCWVLFILWRNYSLKQQLKNTGEKYDTRADVFSYGMVLCELVTRRKPPKRVAGRFNVRDFKARVPPDTPPELFDLIVSCAQFYPEKVR